MSLVTWDRSHFKEDEPSRVDLRLAAEAELARLLRQYDAAIDRRDSKRCRACDKPSDPDRIGLTTRGHRAHIVYASAGGSWEPWNRITLCFRCHNDEHHNRLRFSADGFGAFDANGPMEFWRKDAHGVWFLSRREIRPGQVEHD